MTQSKRFTSTLAHVLTGDIVDGESYEPDVKFHEKVEKVLGEVKNEATKALFSRARTLERLEVEMLVKARFTRNQEERELLHGQVELLQGELEAVRNILWHAVRLEVEPLSVSVGALGLREGWRIVEIRISDLPAGIEALFKEEAMRKGAPSMPPSLLDLLGIKLPS
jgi:hypothetical protein